MEIEIPKIGDLSEIDKIAVQVHECHVKWRPDIFYTYRYSYWWERAKRANR